MDARMAKRSCQLLTADPAPRQRRSHSVLLYERVPDFHFFLHRRTDGRGNREDDAALAGRFCRILHIFRKHFINRRGPEQIMRTAGTMHPPPRPPGPPIARADGDELNHRIPSHFTWLRPLPRLEME